MSVLDKVKALKEQARNSFAPRDGRGFFSTLPGVLAALAAFITASISLVNSCTSANKAVLDRMDRVEQTCVAQTKAEKDAREVVVRELFDKNQALKDELLKNRELTFDYYRKLEQRVLDLEPGPKYTTKQQRR